MGWQWRMQEKESSLLSPAPTPNPTLLSLADKDQGHHPAPGWTGSVQVLHAGAGEDAAGPTGDRGRVWR